MYAFICMYAHEHTSQSTWPSQNSKYACMHVGAHAYMCAYMCVCVVNIIKKVRQLFMYMPILHIGDTSMKIVCMY